MGSWVCCVQGRCALVRCRSGCSKVGVVKMGAEMDGWCGQVQREEEREGRKRGREKKEGKRRGCCCTAMLV
ncbi:hypothetical protein MRB53_012154 [Persea americana]|uniref:Uncharacterized protein n=1 Tax=Persea americana TaxID=3435 RepID=A0ACC2LWM5_PERAE|nr:hypothetical protein MRB53_012154 [Persea americana]